MRLQVPEYIQSLQPYSPGKPIEETQRELGLSRVIKLASNENPLGPSPKALEALSVAASDLHRYPDSSAFRLKNALAKHLGVSSNELLIGNGSNECIDIIIRAFSVSGDTMVTSQAAFIMYKIGAQVHGLKIVETPLTADMRFDMEAMARAVRDDEKAKLVFIANPNNPTGTYVNSTEMLTFLKELKKIRGGSVLVVLDYAYLDYVTAGDLPDPFELWREFPNVIIISTFSKIYGLAGLRIGYAIGIPEIIGYMYQVREPFNSNSLALSAAEAALTDKEFVAHARSVNIQGMEYWVHELKRMKVPFWKSQGNFIMVDPGIPWADIFNSCLRKGVIFRPIPNYGFQTALRITIGIPEENRLGVKALEETLSELKKK